MIQYSMFSRLQHLFEVFCNHFFIILYRFLRFFSDFSPAFLPFLSDFSISPLFISEYSPLFLRFVHDFSSIIHWFFSDFPHFFRFSPISHRFFYLLFSHFLFYLQFLSHLFPIFLPFLSGFFLGFVSDFFSDFFYGFSTISLQFFSFISAATLFLPFGINRSNRVAAFSIVILVTEELKLWNESDKTLTQIPENGRFKRKVRQTNF